jgi:3-hexulose-6-phosphate synthase
MAVYPIVQMSLDFYTIEKALSIAEKAVAAGVDWLEAGTPLILSEGFHAVTRLKKQFPDKTIVSDQKTMDGGGLETELAAKAGADVVVVMAAAHNATIQETVKSARICNVKVMADLLAVKDKVQRAKEIESMGVDYIIVHAGFDERHYDPAATPLRDLRDIVKAVRVPVQAVGGLSAEQAIETLKIGAKLVVFGAPLVIRDSGLDVTNERFEVVLMDAIKQVRMFSASP